MIIRTATSADAYGIARVHVDSWRTTYQGIVPSEYLAALSYEQREKIWFNQLSDTEHKTYHYVAENESGQIMGFVSGGPERNHDPIYKGELYAIYILQAYQGQGIGQSLTLSLVETLIQANLNSMLLWVLTANPARRFYEALGGQLIKASQFEIRGVTIDEVAYGWLDIRPLLKEAEL
ncbi:MAG: GNAT family N-acetyltransferase [Ktedonobacteraceae bacterium]